MEALDLLAIMAHPDDAELACGGTLAAATKRGERTGILDLTRGELGTRGTPELRLQEAEAAGKALGLSYRANLGLSDGFIDPADKQSIIKVVEQIRYLRPRIVIANAIDDRHPDHARAAKLVREAAFLAGLEKISTEWEGENQRPWRPVGFFHILQSYYIEPHIIVDISENWDQKMEAIMAYRSQFFDQDSQERDTFISDEGFLKFVEGRGRDFGKRIGVKFGEAFTSPNPLGAAKLQDLISIF